MPGLHFCFYCCHNHFTLAIIDLDLRFENLAKWGGARDSERAKREMRDEAKVGTDKSLIHYQFSYYFWVFQSEGYSLALFQVGEETQSLKVITRSSSK